MVRQIPCMFALVTAETRESWGKPHVGHTESVCVCRTSSLATYMRHLVVPGCSSCAYADSVLS